MFAVGTLCSKFQGGDPVVVVVVFVFAVLDGHDEAGRVVVVFASVTTRSIGKFFVRADSTYPQMGISCPRILQPGLKHLQKKPEHQGYFLSM
jgi:hypothetical protein